MQSLQRLVLKYKLQELIAIQDEFLYFSTNISVKKGAKL